MGTISISIKEEEKKYPIFIGNETLKELSSFLNMNHPNKRIAVITDDTVNRLHRDKIADSLSNPLLVLVPAGEASKSRKRKEEIEDNLLENNFGRDSIIIAIGGGVIGDLAGFAAATFNRGIPIIHVPTTLLAMVDSSIGGKASVNTHHGKNLIGAFHHPDAVFADLRFLETLPEDEFKSGLAEIIKMAVALDKDLFDFLEKNRNKILARDKDILLHIIKGSIELKRDIVEKDPKESGLRQLLNFGHTFGHALELLNQYKLKHGVAIAQGITVEVKISALKRQLSANDEERVTALLRNFGLPANVDGNINPEKLIELMATDKKSINHNPRFVMLEKIGKCKSENGKFSFEVDHKTISNAIELCKND